MVGREKKRSPGRPKKDRSKDPLAAAKDSVINQLLKDVRFFDRAAKTSREMKDVERAFMAKRDIMPYLAGKAKERQEKGAGFSPEQYVEIAKIVAAFGIPIPTGFKEELNGGQEMDTESDQEAGGTA